MIHAQEPQHAIKIVSRVVSAGRDPKTGKERKLITIPAADLAKVADLKGRPVLVTLQAIL